MKKKARNKPGADKTRKPLAVLTDKHAKQSIVVPLPGLREKLQAEARELEEIRKELAGTTPQGREIIRKVVMIARRKLYGEHQIVAAGQPAAGCARATTEQPGPSAPAPATVSLPSAAVPASTPVAPVAAQPEKAVVRSTPTAARVSTVDVASKQAQVQAQRTVLSPHGHSFGGCSIEEARRLGLVEDVRS